MSTLLAVARRCLRCRILRKRSARSIETATSRWPRPTIRPRPNTWAAACGSVGNARTVRIFNHRLEQVALHVRHEPGRFSTLGDHLVPEKISGIERGAEWLLVKVRGIGPHANEWANAMLRARGIAGVRVLQGLLALDKRYAADDIERACEVALSYGAFHLRPVRQLIRRHAAKQQSLPLLEEHPIIRPLADYGQWLAATLAGHWGKNQRPQFLPPDPHLLPSSLFR